MGHVERVPAARVVHVVAAVVLHEAVVGGVVDAAEGQRRAEVIALGGVVVDHVEDDLDAGPVQRLHHGLELRHLLPAAARGGEARIGGEIADRVVAPVVREASIDQVLGRDRVMHRKELDRGHPQPRQILDRRGRHEPGIGAAQIARDVGMPDGEAFDVHLVDHRLVPWDSRWPVVAPAEGPVDHDRLRQVRRAVAIVRGQILARIADPVAEERLVPAHGAIDRLGIGIEQELRGIEAMALFGLPGPFHAIPVEEPRPGLGQIGVPDVVRLLGQAHAPLLARGIDGVEEAELDPRRVLAEQREVHAGAVPGRAQGIGRAGLDAQRSLAAGSLWSHCPRPSSVGRLGLFAQAVIGVTVRDLRRLGG